MDQDKLKRLAAERAVDYVESGMTLGLGSGSTVRHALRRLGELIGRGELDGIVGVPTSNEAVQRAQEFGIPLTTLAEHPELNLTIDGADEVDPDLNLIKGLGGALLREKIVAGASSRLIIVVDESKIVQQLGTRGPLPIEVVPFGWELQMAYLENLGGQPALRHTSPEQPYVTDNGNYIIDCRFPGIHDPYTLVETLNAQPGIVENGLFLDLADTVLVGTAEGVQILTN